MNKDMKQTKPTGEKQLDKQVSEVQRELHWRFPCSTGMCNVCLAKQTKPTGGEYKIREEEINKQVQSEGVDTNKISDGYHTFGELYEHRIALFIAYCNAAAHYTDNWVWKSKKHSDGSEWDGWFIAGIFKEKGKQITYHLPIDKWDKLSVEEIEFAPEWDGHTSDDVIERIYELL